MRRAGGEVLVVCSPCKRAGVARVGGETRLCETRQQNYINFNAKTDSVPGR
jgi:hypothetical protein